MSKQFMVLGIILVLILIALNQFGMMQRQGNEAAPQDAESAAVVVEGKGSGKAMIGGPFDLLNQNGEPVSEETYAGRYMLVFFGFTHCPAVCPTALMNLTQAFGLLTHELLTQVQPVFITVDPQRDTPERMKEYLKAFHPSFVGLTGAQDRIDEALSGYRAYAKKMDTDMGVMFDHSSFVYVMDREGNYISHFMHNETPENMAEEIKEAIEGYEAKPDEN